MDVIQENLREQFHAADGERPFQFSGDQKGNNQRVQAAGQAPGNRFDETAIRFFSHAEKLLETRVKLKLYRAIVRFSL